MTYTYPGSGYSYYGYGHAYGYYGYGGSYYGDYGYGGGYTSTFGGNFLVDHIPNGSYYIIVYHAPDNGVYRGLYYYGVATRGVDAAVYYYSVTKYNPIDGYYSHKTGYLSEPGPTIQENYSNFQSGNGASFVHYSSEYSYSASKIFFTSTYQDTIYSSPNGSVYNSASHGLFHNDLTPHGSGTYTTYDSTYTDMNGYSYYSHGHS